MKKYFNFITKIYVLFNSLFFQLLGKLIISLLINQFLNLYYLMIKIIFLNN